MANTYFKFKQFTVQQDRCAMKVTTEGCLFGAWCAHNMATALKGKSVSVLDVGAGTGLLSLMIAQKTLCVIEAIEIDKKAAEQAKENVVSSPWNRKIIVINSNVLQWQPPRQFDFIVCNPPFYENDLRSGKSEKNLAHHEEGLRLIDLLLFIATHLNDQGVFFILLPAKRIRQAEKALAEIGLLLYQKTFVKQTPEHCFFRVMMAVGKERKKELEEEVITIKHTAGNYTPAFVSLLKDYYLQF